MDEQLNPLGFLTEQEQEKFLNEARGAVKRDHMSGIYVGLRIQAGVDTAKVCR